MKKFRFNRFNIIVICVTFILLLFLVSSFFHTYSDYVTRDASKIEGDTVYINDLANDYYYYLGMNYVGDVNSNTTNYSESDLKMVTINYYAYPSSDPTMTGYVSLTEQQNKFVYYKYYPIVNNQLTIELIDNPFSLRPVGKGFGGWTSDTGTITQDSTTKTYTLTVSSSTTTINLYANWQNAKVVYVKGANGDDNFDGSSEYNAVASWGRAFELLRTNNQTTNRELNIIVLCGPLDHTINYTKRVTHTWSYSYDYTDHETFENGGTYLIEYKSGNNRYALNDNWSNVATETLSTTTRPSDKSLWIITYDANNGYLIQNKDSGNYLGYQQYYNDQVAIFIQSTPYYWQYDSTLRSFFTNFNLSYTKYTYTMDNNITSGSTYLIADRNSYAESNGTQTLNVFNNSLGNTTIDSMNFASHLWRITASGNGYTVMNTNSNTYLNYNDLDGSTSLTLNNTPTVWNYDSANKTLGTLVSHNQTSYQYNQTRLSATTLYFGYISGNTTYIMNSSRNFVTYSNTSNPPTTDMQWTLVATGSNYYIRTGTNTYLRITGGQLTTTTQNNRRTAFTLDSNNRLYNGSNYLYNNNGSLGITTQANATSFYQITYQQTTIVSGQENMYLTYNNNNWNITTTGSPISFTTYTSNQVNESKRFYLRYDTTNSNFTFDMNTTGTGLYFGTFEENRTMTGTGGDNSVSANSNYNSYNIAATVTSLYDNTDYRNNATLTLNSNYRTIAHADLQLEYLRVSSTGYQAVSDANTQTNLSSSNSSLIGNTYNVRIGRGMTPDSWSDNNSVVFSFMQGGADTTTNTGSNSSSNSNHNFKFVVESGRYSGMMASQIRNNYGNTTAINHYGTIYTVIGCDYDRATSTNTLLDFFYRIGSKNHYGVNGRYNSYTGLAYLMTIKSGTIGMNYFTNNIGDDDTGDDDAYAYSGIYVGGLTVSASSTSGDISSRALIIEGGNIANINGGLRITETNGNNGVTTRIYMKNGNVQNIVGGAGVSTTYGNRYISVTGGNVAYSISAGSNGVFATDDTDQSGRLGGDTYVHVGGEAHVGTGSRNTLYGVTKGSVLGAGNGNDDLDASGRVKTSHVYVSGDAVIEGNVYGGGNFGPVLIDSNITIDGATINGSVYGGANKNGVGTVTIAEATVYNVAFNDDLSPSNGTTYVISKMNGSTRNMLSINGNNTNNVALAQGNQPQPVSRWLINTSGDGYTIRSASNDRYLAYTTTSSPSLTTSANTTNAIWNYDSTNKTFYRDIDYTVSATTSYNYNFGTITSGKEYVITNTNTNSAYSLNSTLGRTTLSTNTEPTVNAWIFTSVTGGYTIQNKDTLQYLTVNGGSLGTSSSASTWTWDSANRRLYSQYNGRNYYLRYRTSNSSFTISTTTYSIYLGEISVNRVTNNARYYLVYDSSWRISTTASSVMLSTFTSTSTTGFTVSNRSNGNVYITMNDGHVLGAIYGGACEEGDVAGKVTININGGHIEYESGNNGSIFGGGYGEATHVANGVDLNINDTINVVVDGTIYGGSALGNIIGDIDIDAIDNSGNGTITVNRDFYCGSMGDSTVSTTGNVQGNCSITLNGGTYNGSVFGGNNANGSPSGVVTVTTGGTNTTTINKVYAGGNQADLIALSATLNIENYSDINEAYGGGNQAAVASTRVNLHGGHADDIYGGSNQSGNITSSKIYTSGGTATNIFGGNNAGGTTAASDVEINGGNITTVYGGGKQATTGTTSVSLKGGTVGTTYGGGQQAGVTTSTLVSLEGGSSTTIYGGSKTSGNVPLSQIVATSGSATTIYGGNDAGGVTTSSNVQISNVSVGKVYGGGRQATTGTSYVKINSGTVGRAYGGGESASITNSATVEVVGGQVTYEVFGGSDTSGTVPASYVNVTGGTIGTIYGGNNAGGSTTATNVTVDGGTVTNIYGGGSAANSTTTRVWLKNSANRISYVFGGCRAANATSTTVILDGGSADKVFGGSDTSGIINTSSVTVNNGNFNTIYGSNNAGGRTVNATVTAANGTIGTVYGGGDHAQTDYTTVNINGASITSNVYGGGDNAAVNYNTSVTVQNSGTIGSNLYGGGNNGQVLGNTSVTVNTASLVSGSLYGGGNNASVTGNTTVVVENATVTNNLFGGGNNGSVGGNTSVNIKNATLLNSAYAGGNGRDAIVEGNTNIVVQGTTTRITNHVFGGGKAAATGDSVAKDSLGVVNITGGTIGGNVYGGANTSVLYGETVVNIGFDAVSSYMSSNNFTRGNISIGGTVFGGGEANESGSETYDFDFISVTEGITINIDGNGHTAFDIAGSIFGSGNASSTSGYSYIYLSNYGSEGNIKNNVSLQRADLAVLNNVHMALSGATDRTNDYSQVLFSLSRITELDLKNNSELYMENGANLLTLFKSLNVNGTKATVQINPNTHAITSRSTNNRIYMHEDKVLNIALNQNVTAYGEVDGMAFFGMFKRDRLGNIVTAMYNTSYVTGDTPAEGDLYYFTSGSYVLGLHENAHNTEVDGFYTNYDDPNDHGKILVDYIVPTPDNAEHYMWTIGASVQSYDIELFASKYSTLGTLEFPFVNNTSGNTTFTVVGFSYDNLDPDVSIINPDNIPRIAATGNDADNIIGLAIKPGIGWVSVGRTYFLTDNVKKYDGTIAYKTENSNITPSFVFYLYHSKNLQTEGLIGTVKVSVEVKTPINDLQFAIEIVNFNITISRVIYDTNDYEGAMTPGRQYEMFTSSNMDITSKSSLSAYYSLYMESNQTIYRNDYHRVLTSNVILPVNTKITMIDFASSTRPEYYYYIVNQADNTALSTASDFEHTHEIEYPLSKFIRMGSLDSTNTYDDVTANGIYYDTTTHRAIEEFIFIVDFKDTTINNSMYDCSLLIDMVDTDNNIIRSVLGIQRSNLVYSLHANQQSAISVSAAVTKPILYAGDIEDLQVTITFNQNDQQSLNRIVDTTYYEQKLGLKVTFFDSDGEQVDGVDLMGTSLTLDGETHYARSDGTIRFKVAERVANSFSNIRIDTENSSLAAGLYTIRVEAFYSTDGIYFGTTPADTCQVTFRLMNKSYGLNITIPEGELIIDHNTGVNVSNTNRLNTTITYSGSLFEPNLKVALYRRSYSTIFDLNYNLVDLADYVTNNLTASSTNVYELIDELENNNTYTFNFTNNLVSGTYKLEFRLYDDDAYVGNIVKYIIIK